MEITRGKILKAKKVIIYGPEGIGKSTFASKFPEPVFIDTEESTKEMDVARLPAPSSWQMILEETQYVKDHPDCCKTLVIDTADKAQQYAINTVLAEKQFGSIEDPGYGKGYVYVYEKFGKLLTYLDDVVNRGINVVITAHATMRKFEQPDEMGAYDRWEMKLVNSKNCNASAMLREWADMVLFANYKTMVVSVDKEGKKKKAQGEGRRVMYATHHSCWDAKNRYGLPDMMDFDFSEIAHIFRDIPAPAKDEKPKTAAKKGKKDPEPAQSVTNPDPEELSPKSTEPAPTAPAEPEKVDAVAEPVAGRTEEQYREPDPRIPKALRDLMIANRVTDWDIQEVCAANGYYPSDVEIWDYDPEFIDGCLVGAWPQVLGKIKEMWDTEEIPFN